MKVKRKSIFGNVSIPILVASLVIAANSEFMQVRSRQPNEPQIVVPPFEITTTVDMDEINGMNIILNDDDCSNAFFQDVVTQLQEDGIELTVTEDGNDINQDNATIITIDQQYSAGNNTIVFAPYDNARVGHSDSLALSMQTAFEQSGFPMDNLQCGQVGFQKAEDGTIQSFVPTQTEEKMDEDCDSSFVTISLGTSGQDPVRVAKTIENGLARQNIYLKSDDNQTDLVYRANSGDSLDGVADYFGTDALRLKIYNGIRSDEFQDSQTVVNPYVEDMRAFQSNMTFDYKTDAKTH